MCESNVLLLQDGDKELLMENVISVRINGDELEFYGILGDSKTVKGEIQEIDLLSHEILVKPQ